MHKFLKYSLLTILSIILIITITLTIIYVTHEPSNDGNWIPECAVLPSAIINGDLVTVQNVRNQTYDVNGPTSLSYYNQTYNLSQIETLWFIVEPFALWGASAHTFVSFGFENGEYISVSVEARFEENETYGALKGVLDTFELWYIWGSEVDQIGRRTNWFNEEMYLYPINTSKEKMQELFLEMARYTNKLHEEPEFYNTLTNTCTSSLADRVQVISPGKIGWTIATSLPGFSDKHLYKKGMINTTVPFSRLRITHAITPVAQNCSNENFSLCIRAHLPS